MARCLVIFVSFGILLLFVGPLDLAWGQGQPDDFRRSMGNLRPDARTAGGAIQGSGRSQPPPQSAPEPTPPEAQPEHGHDGHGHRGGGRGGWDCPDHGYGFGYDPYTPYGYPAYPYYPPPYWGYPYPPPLYLPAETIYGPEAIKRFMGFYPNAAAAPVDVIVAPEPAKDRPADEEAIPLRGTDAESIALGRKFVGYGDAQFIEQQYAQAYIRYKKAAQAAPQLAQAYFRQGWSLVASGRYELAAAAFQKGLGLDAGWPRSDFRLDELYGPNRLAKTAHVDALAAAAAAEPQNADLLFLVGVFLFFDGQPHRARPFFERLRQMPGSGAAVGGFLEAIEPRNF